jgi:excisionase family DNA binding protein
VKNIMTVKEVAEELGISEERVRKLCQQGRMGEKVAGVWLITRDQFQAFLETYTGKPGRPPKEE